MSTGTVAARKPASYRGPIIDLHTHPSLPGIPAMPVSGSAPPPTWDEYLRRARPLDLRQVGGLVMAPRGDLPETARRNDVILDWARRSPDRCLPFCSVHPADGDAAIRELDRVAAAGARGIKLHPNTQQFDVADDGVRAVVDRAGAHHLPVLFDAYSPFDADQPGKFLQLAISVPHTRLILAHAYGSRFAELLVYRVVARYDWWKRNVWIDLSATSVLLGGGPLASSFAWVLRQVGVDRLLFGSDFPFDDPVPAARAVVSLGFTAPELSRIFFENARDLLGP